MRRQLLSAIALALICATAWRVCADADADLVQLGRKYFAVCTQCHPPLDSRIPEDRDWTQLNLVSSCSNSKKPKLREAINAYVTSPKARRPSLVDVSYKPAAGRPHGQLKLPTTAGSLLLKIPPKVANVPPARRFVRVCWPESKAGTTLPVPVGDYQVINYQFYRTTKDGAGNTQRWNFSGTARQGCERVIIKVDEMATFGLRPEAKLTLSEQIQGEDRRLKLELKSGAGNAISITRDGNMNAPSFRLVNGMQVEVHQGIFGKT